MVQSGVVEKNARNPIRGGDEWVLKKDESPLSHRVNLNGEPRDEEVNIGDVLALLARWEERAADLTTTRIAVVL